MIFAGAAWRRVLVTAAVVPGVLFARGPAGGRDAQAGERGEVVVASKPFGESYLLAEMFAQLLEARGYRVTRRPGLGATEVALAALRTGAVDVYPEYTGTGLVAVLHDSTAGDPRAVYARVATEFERRYGVRWLPPLGFQNTYAIAVRRGTADSLHLRTLSDLGRASARLTAGFTADFIGRTDGLPGLTRVYGVRPREVHALGQAVKYQALASGAVDVVDGYSTDGLIARYDLAVLQDDRAFFPPYEAAALVGPRRRADAGVVAALVELSGRLTESRMRALNRRVEVDHEALASVAASALGDIGVLSRAPGGGVAPTGPSFGRYLWQRRGLLASLVVRHVELVGASLAAAGIVALPLALLLERRRRVAEGVIRATGLLQTIPGIALLAFMLPVLGVGARPAIAALFVYAIFPIVRSTYSGLRDADPAAVDAARALGMTPRQVLLDVRLPLAVPSMMAGLRTAAVIDVGTATLAAFIGGGGLGEPIATGLALADTRLVLSGAIPAAALALLVDAGLGRLERALSPAYQRSLAS